MRVATVVGAHASTLNQCTVSGNTSAPGGGISYSTANDCLISGNIATTGGGAVGLDAEQLHHHSQLVRLGRGRGGFQHAEQLHPLLQLVAV